MSSRDTDEDLVDHAPRIGRYELREPLGAGGMGVVWLATDPQLDRPVAIKVVHPDLTRDPAAASRLLREARAMAKLSHPSVVAVHDVGEVDGQLFIAMELVRGTTLGALIKARDRNTRDDWRHWLRMMIDAGRGLAAAHAVGLLHRDFKPDNVLVGESGRVCVADFGLATSGAIEIETVRRSLHRAPTDEDLTVTGALMGTPAYMSPEQLETSSIDARSDQFSFCVSLWQVLYGERPFRADLRTPAGLAVLAEAIAAGPPPVGPTRVPVALEAILRRGLAQDPAARWPDMSSLLAALEEVATPPAFFGRRAVIAGLVVAIAVTGFAIAMVARRSGAPREPTKLWDVPLQASIALSPGGDEIAIADTDIEVRALRRGGLVRLSVERRVGAIQFTGDVLHFSLRDPEQRKAWAYRVTTTSTEERSFPGQQWFGTTSEGELQYDKGYDRLEVVHGERVVDALTPPVRVTQVSIAPGRRRYAYVEDHRDGDLIVVRDVASHTSVTSLPLVGVTAITWKTDRALLYAVDTPEGAVVHQVGVDDRFGESSVVAHGSATISRLAAGEHGLYGVEIETVPKIRLLDTETTSAEELDRTTATVPLGWVDDTTFYAWNRRTQRIDLRDTNRRVIASLPWEQATEPINATSTADRLIVTARVGRGREIIGFARHGNAAPWRLSAFAVRCSDDRAPPCFLARPHGDEMEIVAFDATTGTPAGPVLHHGAIEDFAVAPGGAELAAVGRGGFVTRVDLASGRTETIAIPLATGRSIAYLPIEGFVIAGTLSGATYQIGRLIDGKFGLLGQADNEVLALARSSPGGTRIHVLARTYSAALFRL